MAKEFPPIFIFNIFFCIFFSLLVKSKKDWVSLHAELKKHKCVDDTKAGKEIYATFAVTARGFHRMLLSSQKQLNTNKPYEKQIINNFVRDIVYIMLGITDPKKKKPNSDSMIKAGEFIEHVWTLPDPIVIE